MNLDSNSQRRSSLLRKNILASFLVKGWSALVVLMMVPITLNCLGEYKNGIWLTISSLLLWIDNLDIGLGNGMRNKLAALMAHDETEKARIVVSSTFAMLTIIIIPVAIVLLGCILTFDMYGVFNANTHLVTDLEQVLIVTILLVCATFIFKLIGNFYMGLQLPAVSNALVTGGQTVALIGTYLVYRSGSHSLLYVAIVNTLSPLIVYILAYIYTFYIRYTHLRPSIKLVSLTIAKEMFNVGVQFFIMQISSVVLFMSSNILISNLFSPEMVTPYQITYRYFSILLVLFTVICMPYWNATTDAYERGDMEWIRNATRRLNLMTLAIMACMMVMLLLSNAFYSVWIHNDEVTVPFGMSVMMAIYIFILIYSMRYSYFINGIGKLRLQLIFTASAALVFIPLAYWVANKTNNILWFMAVMCLVNLPGLIVNRIQFQKLLNGTARGIWIK